MERVLYFSGYRTALYERNRKIIKKILDFEPSPEGLKNYERYLINAPKTPIYFIADIVEEDFFYESLTKLSGKKADTYIDKSLRKHFRDNSRTHFEYLNPDPDNKKRFISSLSAITNPDFLTKWINPILEQNLPFAGIYSAPLLNKYLLKHIKTKKKKCLIITQHIISAIRFTFLDNGKVVFTRSSKIDYDLLDANNYEAISTNISTDIENTFAYLFNQKKVHYDEKIETVAILTPQLHDGMKQLTEAKGGTAVRFISIQRMIHHLGLKGLDCNDASSTLAAAIPKPIFNNDHYSTTHEQKTFISYRKSQILNVLSVCMIAFSLLSGIIYSSNHKLLRSNILINTSQTESLEEHYISRFGSLDAEHKQGYFVKDAVHLAKELQQYANISPNPFYIELSKILNKFEFSSIILKKIDWQMLDKDTRNALGLMPEKDDELLAGLLEDEFGNPIDAVEEIEEEPKTAIEYVGILEGTISSNELVHRHIVDTMHLFIKTLENLALVNKIEILALPVDLRTTSEFSETVNSANSKRSEDDSYFKLILIMGSNSHV